MKRKLIYLSLLLSLTTAQCKKDPPSLTRGDVYNSGNYPSSMDQLFSVMIGNYSNLRSVPLFGYELLSKDMASMEHTSDVAYSGDASWNALSINNIVSSNGYADGLWAGLYRGVKNVNVFFDRAAFYKANYAKSAELSDIAYMEGESHFLRAYYYFNLECFFGESYMNNGAGGEKMGVPLTSLSNTLEGTQVSRNTVREVWDFIIADLKEAELLLKGKVWSADQQARVNEWAVKTLLGKAYLFTGDYANAKNYLKDVIDNSGKALMPYSKFRDAFNGKPENEYNEESIFEVNVDVDELAWGKFSTDIDLTTSQGLIWAPSFLGDDGTEDNAGALGFGNVFVHDKNLKRFGFNLPLWTLTDNPNFNNSSDPSPYNPRKIIDSNYRRQSLDIRSNKTADPRLYVCALQPWVDSVSDNGGISYKPVARYKEIPLSIRQNYYGWSFRKYATINNSLYAINARDGANIYVYRLADVYLMYAEACAMTGDNINALEYLNKVKRRAYDLPVNSTSLIDYTSLTDATKATDPVLSNDPLKYERWAELFNEGHWWFDVCRWRIGSQEAAYYQSSVAGGNILWDDAKSYVWPIPLNEINTNSKIKQNPGY